MQTTLRRPAALAGTGLHSGRPARLVIRPAEDGGIRFRRVDIDGVDTIVPARWDRVSDTTLSTVLTNAAGIRVGTVEHVMAALAGLGVTHAVIDLDGPEVPIMDGSAQRFVRAILRAGLRVLPRPVEAIRVLRPVTVAQDGVSAMLEPAPGLSIDFAIDFPGTAIGSQRRVIQLANGAFVRELADCRTFCRREDVEGMQARGLALGGTLDNAVVVDGPRVLNPGGFRREDECVRHKILDALGDLALAGAPILGAYLGIRAGHGITNRLLHRLFSSPGNWERVTLDEAAARLLPGAGLGLPALRRAG
jgi:UDP-3-O-[3-hydroxymyristoyl] N-acetylglucosamine deacetylase